MKFAEIIRRKDLTGSTRCQVRANRQRFDSRDALRDTDAMAKGYPGFFPGTVGSRYVERRSVLIRPPRATPAIRGEPYRRLERDRML